MENLILHFYRYNKQMEAETFGIVTWKFTEQSPLRR
jgi:hypothetical protein